MPLKSLEKLAGKIVYEALPANWNTFDLVRFSTGKQQIGRASWRERV